MGRVKRKKGRESEALGRLNFRFVADCVQEWLLKLSRVIPASTIR